MCWWIECKVKCFRSGIKCFEIRAVDVLSGTANTNSPNLQMTKAIQHCQMEYRVMFARNIFSSL